MITSRTEEEMLELIVGTARDDKRIRAVILNGSRANPNAPRDPFQDFDIVYLVTDVIPFKEDRQWIKRFGETMIVQLPEEMQDPPPAADEGFTCLMQFMDGNRIDLGIYPLDRLNSIGRDSLSVLLLDKDGIIEPFPLANESDYLPSPPTAKAFSDCCNEFWWVCPYVAKGLWRREIVYAKTMLDAVVREELMKMLVWHIGLKTDFSVNPGKLGKYFRRYLEPGFWDRLMGTYADASYEHTWDAMFIICDLFREVAIDVAEQLGFEYPLDDDTRVSAYLKHIRQLPKDATSIF
jgi:aminoglycoside 6-adenylyltransferase